MAELRNKNKRALISRTSHNRSRERARKQNPPGKTEVAYKLLESELPMSLRGAACAFLLATALCLSGKVARASFVYIYDFPGAPGSGLASDQSNPQPSGATFSDFTRNGGLTGTGNNGVFGSKNWSTSAAMDPTIFTAFTITADPGLFLTLSQMTFDSLKNHATLPLFAEVDLFLNGSSTAYATFSWAPQNSPMTNYVFDFADVTADMNVTTATFKFFAWNATDGNTEVQFDNVTVSGGVDVPETSSLGPAALLIGCSLLARHWQNGRISRRAAL